MLVHNSRSPPVPTQSSPLCYYSSPTKASLAGPPNISLESPENPSRLASLKRLQNSPRWGNINLPRQLAEPGTWNSDNIFPSALFMPIYSSNNHPQQSRSSSATDESGQQTPSFVSARVPAREILYSSSKSAASSSSESLPQPVPVPAVSYANCLQPTASNFHELRIDVGGIQGYLNWEALKFDIVDPFFGDGVRSHSNSLLIEWTSSRADPHGWRAVTLVRDLINQLGYRVLVRGTPQIALSTFSSLTISIPDIAIQQTHGQDNSRKIAYENLMINLDEARNLREFNWQGDLYVLATIFKGVPSTSLTILSLLRCHITDQDAVSLIHACPHLMKATLESVTPRDACPSGNLMRPSTIPVAQFQSLTDLSIRSFVSLMFLFERADFPRLLCLDLNLDRVAAQDVDRLAIRWSSLRKLRLHCGLTETQYKRLQSLAPRLNFKVTKIQE